MDVILMKGMEEKMLKKKNEFFVIFGMLALCVMLATACDDEGGGGENKDPETPADPTPKELVDAAGGSIAAAAIGPVTASDEKLVFVLTPPDESIGSSIKFTVTGLTVGAASVTPVPTELTVTKGSITVPVASLVDATTFTDTTAVTVKVKAESGTASSAEKSITIDAASIASATPAIAALRQVKADLAGAGSATITEGGTAAILFSTGTVSTVVGDVSVLLSGSTTVSGSNDSFDDEDIASTFSNAFIIGTVASFSGVNGVLGIKDEGYEILPGGTTIEDFYGTITPSGTITAVGGTNSAGSDTVTFKPVVSGSVSAAFDGIVLTAEKLTYTAPLFTITVHTDRYGEEYGVVVGTGAAL